MCPIARMYASVTVLGRFHSLPPAVATPVCTLSSGVACNRRSAKVPNWLPAAALHVSHGTAPSCPSQRCSCRHGMSLYDTPSCPSQRCSCRHGMGLYDKWSIQCIPVRVIHSASAFTPIKPSLHVLSRRIRMHVCVSFIEPSCVCHSCVCVPSP